MTTKITSANIDATVASAADIVPIDSNAFNISLLGFKMAVNEGLTVFNLVDGVVDEFNDESGTDEAEGSNDLYCASGDFYQNLSQTPTTFSAGFTITTITEPDTSTASTNPAHGTGSVGTFTVPSGTSSVDIYTFGTGGSGGSSQPGGGGGFAKGTLAVTSSDVLKVFVGEGGGGVGSPASVSPSAGTNASIRSHGEGGAAQGPLSNSYGMGGGGGLTGVFNNCFPGSLPGGSVPQAFVIAGGGGASGYNNCSGGPGGGLIGRVGEQGCYASQTAAGVGPAGAPGGRFSGAGGQAGGGAKATPNSQNGGLFFGGNGSSPGGHSAAGGGSGFYGGGGTNNTGPCESGHAGNAGGGSSYYGHPQITCGTTITGCVAGTNEGYSAILGACGPTILGYDPLIGPSNPQLTSTCNFNSNGLASATQTTSAAGDGYVFITGSYCVSSPGGSSTIVSNSFTSTTVPTSSRIVVFEENVDTPTLNTDIIASISRDAGVTFTNATLADSGYVTGSSGQRILTGQADISGQPSGQSMRWKLALANNTVKIHGVSLQWS